MSSHRPLPILPYTLGFKRRIGQLFPPTHRIHKLVNEGSPDVGEYLAIKEDNWYCTVEEVLQAINGSDADRAKLQKEAHKRAELYELQGEWRRLADLAFLIRFHKQAESAAEHTNNPRP